MTALPQRTIVKNILWIIATVGLVAVVARFTRGLGATTALTDATPWGLWIGFDVMAGVALAAGGFTVAAAVYVFHLEKYRPVLRPAILTAFLGYGAVIVGLLCDLGLPWHIWSPIIHWQPRSVLFEVAWCVMLYTSVLALEFAPVALEHRWFSKPAFKKAALWLKRLTLPLVILGIVLSTLHQSSLGSLFLLMPGRLHPLWYSPLLPLLFFVSAVALGLMMVTLEGYVSAYLFDHPVQVDLLSGLGRAAGWVLWGYVALRLGDLAGRGALPAAVALSGYSLLFWAEIGAGALLPAILLSLPRVRTNPAGLLASALLTVGGMVLNRLAVGGLAMLPQAGRWYMPNWVEFAVSAGIVAGAGLVFLYLAENLAVFGPAHAPAPAADRRYARPTFDPVTGIYRGRGGWDIAARRSMLLAPVVALAVALLPAGVVGQPAQPEPAVRAARGYTVMVINGNRNQQPVDFDHLDHQQRLAKSTGQGCETCHHLSKPDDEATACWECHQAMHQPASIFNHTLHQTTLGGNAGCTQCHPAEHIARTAKPCGDCHETMMPPAGQAAFNHAAPGYQTALHGTCLTCHEHEAKTQGKPELARCPACHKTKEKTESAQSQAAQIYEPFNGDGFGLQYNTED